jgi:tryptophan-rich sensory protein
MLQIDAVLVLALYAAVFWQQSRTTMKESQEYYETRKKYLCCAPAPWVFGVAWTLLYTLKLLSGYFFLYSGLFNVNPGQEGYYVVAFIFYLIEIVLNKWWSVLFFDLKKPGWALVVSILMVLSVIVYIVFLCLPPHSENWWLPIVFISVYLVWLVFATVWNIQWIMSEEGNTYKKMEDSQSANSPIIIDLEKQQEQHHQRRNAAPGKPALKVPTKYQINL